MIGPVRQQQPRGRSLRAVLLAVAYGAVLCAGTEFSGPAGPLHLESKSIGRIEYVPLLDVAFALRLTARWYYESRLIEIRNASLSIDLMVGSRCIVIDRKTAKRLPATVVLVRGEPFVPASFVTSTLAPYAARWAGKTSRNAAVVVLDPGHGGNDQGATGHGGLLEKNLTLDLARRVRQILVNRGYKVRLTRDTDVFVPLESRPTMAQNVGAAAFVSIHANAVTRNVRAIRGIETFYYPTTPKTRSILEHWKRRFFGDATPNRSRELATYIQTKLVEATGTPNRGVKDGHLVVLRTTSCPACLTEIGFISNPTDAALMGRDDHRTKIANAIAQGIISLIGPP